MESEANYPCINQQAADLEMSYRTCSQVWTPYLPAYFGAQPLDALLAPAQHFKHKHNAIIYINSNCATASGRHQVVMHLQQLLQASNSTLAVHSYGSCSPNMDAATLADFRDASGSQTDKKRSYQSKYKFCVAMENSLARDYVSEKVYDALAAGCVPIYWGAANIQDFIPHNSSIVDYSQLGSPGALQAELERLASNETAYAEKLAWRTLEPSQWNPGFLKLLEVRQQPWCELCALASTWRAESNAQNYTLCAANSMWLSRPP